MGFGLVDVCSSGANERRDTVSPDEARVGAIVEACGICDRDAEGTQCGSGSGTGKFFIVTSISGPDERGVER